ncbi:uncharacterized protein LOC116301111 [Actinia tenebrosa]|uniref:Uncharacterized protein LOC116301111 n=1 Tax=Actinia tenebrosa TaxID=6105 RepID=A0A6P8IH52_ACTTE|nr:uncharacterized protein LOC116301111 [Actinia tenebrosa]
MAWGKVKPEWDKSQRTSASKSTIYYQDIRPAREFSRIFIQSRTKDGQIKRIGGDSWRVYLRGPSSIAATVFDHNNGTYEALFLVKEPGTYTLKVILDFSLCDGFRDPPIDWFIKDILSPESSCDEACDFLLDGFGRWINDNEWLPYMNESSNARIEPGTQSAGSLIVYGDSLAYRFGLSIARNKNVCGGMYKTCSYRYNWIYPINTTTKEQRINLFNAYATWAMCKAGIPVLDVHPVSESFAPGAYDVTHYKDFVFNNAEKALEAFKINELNGRQSFRTQFLGSKCNLLKKIIKN